VVSFSLQNLNPAKNVYNFAFHFTKNQLQLKVISLKYVVLGLNIPILYLYSMVFC